MYRSAAVEATAPSGREVELTVDYTLSGDFPDMDAAVTI